jgi:hypothetical protein
LDLRLFLKLQVCHVRTFLLHQAVMVSKEFNRGAHNKAGNGFNIAKHLRFKTKPFHYFFSGEPTMFNKFAIFTAILFAAVSANAATLTNKESKAVEVTVIEGTKKSSLKVEAGATTTLPEQASAVEFNKNNQKVVANSNFEIQGNKLTASAAPVAPATTTTTTTTTNQAAPSAEKPAAAPAVKTPSSQH